MHLNEIQLEKFMRHNMNMNKNFFYTFLVFSLATLCCTNLVLRPLYIRICIHFTSRVEAFNMSDEG